MLTDHPAAGLDAAALAAETDRLLDFGVNFPHPDGGSVWLGDAGQPDLGRPVFTYITARMAHVYALGVGLGRPEAARLTDAALRGLTGRLHDTDHGGWFSAINPDGSLDDTKQCYAHAFVVLAAASASVAGRPGADELLVEALALWQDRFFDTDAGMFVDAWDRTFTTLDPYRGANANMHAVEALLAAGDATANPALHEQALVIAERIVVEFAEPRQWRIPEHFTSAWEPLLEHHRDQPDHPFQPYGATVGHGLEWSRLLLHLEASRRPTRIGAGVAAARRREPLRPGGRRRLVRRRAAWLHLHDQLGRGAGRRRPDALGHRRGRVGSRGAVPADRRTPVRRTRTDLVGVRRGATTSTAHGVPGSINSTPPTARRTQSGRANPTSTTPSRRH